MLTSIQMNFCPSVPVVGLSRAVVVAGLLLSTVVVPSSVTAQSLSGYDFGSWFGGGATSPAPSTPAPTPPPAPPAPTFTPTLPPPPAPPPPVRPLLVGTGSGLTLVPSMASIRSQLNQFVGNLNSTGANLPYATLAGAALTDFVVPTAPAPLPPPTVSTFTSPPPAPVISSIFDSWFGAGATPPPAPSAPPPPPPPAPLAPPPVLEINLNVTGWQYLVLKWGDVNHHFYVGDSSGVQTFRGTAPLSSYSTYFASVPVASVPEGGASLALLVGGLFSLAALRRRFRK